MGIIYCARNTKTGMMYIGQTVRTITQRRKAHEGSVRWKNNCRYFANALRHYGVQAFEWTVIAESDSDHDLNTLEREAIAFRNTMHPFGYNLTEGGRGGRPSSEVRDRIRAKLKGKPKSSDVREHMAIARKTRVYSDEARQAMRTNAGRTMSQETRNKMSKAQSNRSPEVRRTMSESRKGKTVSQETRQKLSEAASRRVISTETRVKISESLKKRFAT